MTLGPPVGQISQTTNPIVSWMQIPLTSLEIEVTELDDHGDDISAWPFFSLTRPPSPTANLRPVIVNPTGSR